MGIAQLVPIEFKKVKRSKIVPLIFIAPLLVVISGIASLSRYFTPEYTNAWPAMFIQSALVYAYYLLPLSMVVVCVMISARESQNNGILKMLALPVKRETLGLAKFLVVLFYLAMEIVVFFVVFVVAGLFATLTMDISETMPILDLVKWCAQLFITSVPSVSLMWLITVLFEKPLLSIGLNLLLVIPGVLAANTPLWVVYPYCYSGYLVSTALRTYSAAGDPVTFSLFPFVPCAIVITLVCVLLSMKRFGKKEMK